MSHIFITTEDIYNNYDFDWLDAVVISPHQFFEDGQNQEIFAKKWPYNYLRHTMITRDNSNVLLTLSSSHDNSKLIDYLNQNNIDYTITLVMREDNQTKTTSAKNNDLINLLTDQNPSKIKYIN